MYVHHFGHKGGTGGIKQTTTTTTISNTVDASVSVPGVSMNISINDPGVSSTTTTTTTSHSSHSSHTTTTDNNDQSNTDNGCHSWALKQADFVAAKKTISDASFEDTKLSTAKSIASANCLSADQEQQFAIFLVSKIQNLYLQNMLTSTQPILKIILKSTTYFHSIQVKRN